jgi:serine/threonine-protein kinase RsbT
MAKNHHDALRTVLERHLSGTHARLVLTRSMRGMGLSDSVGEDHLASLVSQIEKTARFFLDGKAFEAFRKDLEGVTGKSTKASLVAKSIPIEVEDDIVGARSTARDLAQALGGSKLAVQKIATVVSELARNIISYTPGGQIELIPTASPPSMAILAIDRGSGIKDLEHVLSGRYKSKTGLGRGLFGSRQLADKLEIQTGANGTRIEAVFRL